MPAMVSAAEIQAKVNERDGIKSHRKSSQSASLGEETTSPHAGEPLY